jgi:hypothetical protein
MKAAAAFAIACGLALAGCAAEASRGRRAGPVQADVLERYGPVPAGEARASGEEAASIAGASGVRREGGVLTVDASEGVQVRFVDAGTCEGFDTCRRWTYVRGLRTPRERYQLKRMLPEPQGWMGYATSEMDHVIHHVIQLNHGEGVEHWVVDGHDGTAVTLADEPLPSPDGRMWAAGGCDELAGCRFELWRLGAQGPVVSFRAPEDSDCCEVIAWDGPQAVRVVRGVGDETPSRVESSGAGWIVRAAGRQPELRLLPVLD